MPYRVVNIAVDDLGASAAKKYDIEAWLPGQGRYREVTSTSNTTDFQARRLEIRMRRENGKPEVLHTLNGTAVAVSRTLIALLENGQRDDGSIGLPAVLAPVRRAGRAARGLSAAAVRRGDVRDRRLAVVEDVERAVEVRDLKEPQHGRVRADEREVAAPLADEPQAVEQHAQPRRVDELDAGHVEHDRGLAALDRGGQALGEARRRRDVDLAADADDVGAVAGALLGRARSGGRPETPAHYLTVRQAARAEDQRAAAAPRRDWTADRAASYRVLCDIGR